MGKTNSEVAFDALVSAMSKAMETNAVLGMALADKILADPKLADLVISKIDPELLSRKLAESIVAFATTNGTTDLHRLITGNTGILHKAELKAIEIVAREIANDTLGAR